MIGNFVINYHKIIGIQNQNNFIIATSITYCYHGSKLTHLV